MTDTSQIDLSCFETPEDEFGYHLAKATPVKINGFLRGKTIEWLGEPSLYYWSGPYLWVWMLAPGRCIFRLGLVRGNINDPPVAYPAETAWGCLNGVPGFKDDLLSDGTAFTAVYSLLKTHRASMKFFPQSLILESLSKYYPEHFRRLAPVHHQIDDPWGAALDRYIGAAK